MMNDKPRCIRIVVLLTRPSCTACVKIIRCCFLQFKANLRAIVAFVSPAFVVDSCMQSQSLCYCCVCSSGIASEGFGVLQFVVSDRENKGFRWLEVIGNGDGNDGSFTSSVGDDNDTAFFEPFLLWHTGTGAPAFLLFFALPIPFWVPMFFVCWFYDCSWLPTELALDMKNQRPKTRAMEYTP